MTTKFVKVDRGTLIVVAEYIHTSLITSFLELRSFFLDPFPPGLGPDCDTLVCTIETFFYVPTISRSFCKTCV